MEPAASSSGPCTACARCQARRSGWVATSGPCLIEGSYGMGDESGIGNFELCVTVGETIEHWWRHNASGAAWTRAAVFGDAARRVVGLIQSSFRPQPGAHRRAHRQPVPALGTGPAGTPG